MSTNQKNKLKTNNAQPPEAKMKAIENLGKNKIFKDANYPYAEKMGRSEYEAEKEKLFD